MKRFTYDDIMAMVKEDRLHFINAVPGFKSANLIGTKDLNNCYNLAVFSSVIHLGSHPPYLGFVTRPTTVPRHTLDNILNTAYYTINHIHKDFYPSAHQTSAKYERGESEFDKVGLTPEPMSSIAVPYVQEASVKIGMEYVERHHITANDTLLVVGRIIEILIQESIIQDDHAIDLDKAGTVAISGIEGYHQTHLLDQLGYAQPGDPIPEPKQKGNE